MIWCFICLSILLLGMVSFLLWIISWEREELRGCWKELNEIYELNNQLLREITRMDEREDWWK